MPKIKYHYACDEVGNIVDIHNVSPVIRSMHDFHCLSCKAEMVARLGNKNAHHFAHKKEDGSCSTETYLHKLGKVLLKKRFEESPTFIVKYLREIKCSKESSCAFACNECAKHKYEDFDLKKYYDTCEEERWVGDFRADLCLSNSLNKGNGCVLIEICVTHESTQEKRRSGLRIIEIKICSENGLLNIVKADSIKETSDPNDRYYKEVAKDTELEEPKIKFWGFKRDSGIREQLSLFEFPRFSLFSSGSAFVRYVTCNEGEAFTYSILELNVFDGFYGLGFGPEYEYGLVTAINMGYDKKNCILCKYHRENSIIESQHANFCCLYKKYGTPVNPTQTDAQTCKYYCLDTNRIEKIKTLLPNIIISRIK